MSMYGPATTFLGIEHVDLDDDAQLADLDVVIIGAPFDGGTSFRPGCRFGPLAIRGSDCQVYDASRPHLSLRVDPLKDLRVADGGDIEMPPGDIELSLARVRAAVARVANLGVLPVILGGDHSIAYPDIAGVADAKGDIAVVHFDAHADTADTHFGQLYGHGTPMRRLIESGACRGDHFFQVGLRGYWPGPETLAWMAQRGMRSYEMTEVRSRGLEAVLDEVCLTSTKDCETVFLSVDIDVVDPAIAPGTGTPEPGGWASWELLSAVRKVCLSVEVSGLDVVEVSPPYDHANVTAHLANRVVLEALSSICHRRKGIASEPRWAPERPLLDER